MRLAAAARAFNKTECLDAYSGRRAFFGQFGLYDDNKRDSETAERRILSVEDGITVPSRRVIEAAGTRWIVGHSNPDSFRGRTVRQGLVVHEATYLSEVRTLEQVCLNQVGIKAWAGRAWIKNLAFTEQSSDLVPQYHIHYSSTEAVGQDNILTFEDELHVARVVTTGPSGTLIVLADRLPEPVVEVATVSGGVYDPVAGQMSAGSGSVRVIRVRWQSLFQYRHASAPTFGPADIQVVIAKASMTPSVGIKLEMSDGTWQLASVISEGAVWLCRATKHG